MGTRTDQLIPFDSETASRAGKRSAEVRRQRALARQVAAADDARTLATHLQTFQDTFQREELGAQAAAVGAYIMARIAAGQIPIRHAGDAADLLTALHNMTRLEEGQATSHVMHGSVEIVQRIEALRAELNPPTTGPNP